jgi:hypothetical protein
MTELLTVLLVGMAVGWGVWVHRCHQQQRRHELLLHRLYTGEPEPKFPKAA